MERIMSVEERIRKAEEIYNRRNNGSKSEKITKLVVNEKKSFKLLRKLIIQIIICLVIYCVFYGIAQDNFFFSQDFKNKVKEILNYDINFKNLYNNVIEKFNNIFEENNNNQNVDNEKKQSNEDSIGGAHEEIFTNNEINNEINIENEIQNFNDEEKYIKENVNFIKPVEGIISSKFGYRETSNTSIPKNHTGLDISAAKGTKIVSATDGNVILSSSEGDYRKSYSNTNR